MTWRRRRPSAHPRSWWPGIADDGSDFVLVLEDLTDWDNVDHLAGLTLRQACLVTAELANLHA